MGAGVSYAHLLRVTVRHGYYGTRAAQALPIDFVGMDARTFQRAGLRSRSTPQGVDLYADATTFDPKTIGSFLIDIATPPEFGTATAPNWSGTMGAREVLFLSDEKALRDGRKMVIDAQSGDVLPIRPPSFRYASNEALGGHVPMLIAWRDGTCAWRGKPHKAGARGIDVFAPDVPEGRYTLTFGHENLLTFYLSDRPPEQINVVADIELPKLTTGQETSSEISLNFSPRSCHWRYEVLTGPTGEDFSTASIKPRGSGSTFSGPTKHMRGSKTVLIFTSDEPIPLSAQGDASEGYDYHPPQTGNHPERVMHCPLATADNVSVEQQGSATSFWATMDMWVETS